MSITKLAVCLGTLAMAVASAASSYNLTLFQSSTIGDRELKPGEYKVEVNGDKAVIKAGKNTVETAVKVENGSEKFQRTVVKYNIAGGKSHVQEIRLAGTKTTLVFDEASTN